MSTHTSREKATAFESEKSSSLYFELILTTMFYFIMSISMCTLIFKIVITEDWVLIS